MEIIEDKQNDLLRRRELKIITDAGKNPSREDAVKMIAEHFKADEENIVVNSIRGKFGRKTFLIVASIYANKEDKEKTEITSKKKRDADKKAAEAAAAPKAEGEKKVEA
jgi:ribosomal protein S24E